MMRVDAPPPRQPACLLLGGCGSTLATSAKRPVHATLMLDFVPNAVHAGIYRALSAGYDRRAGIDLSVIPPGSTSDPLALIDTGRIEFALADGIDVAEQAAQGHDAVAIMAIVQDPLGVLIALRSEHLRSPVDLAGRTVGITGVPSHSAVLATIVRAGGGQSGARARRHDRLRRRRGPRGGQGRGVHGLLADDGVTVAQSGQPVEDFKLNQWGGPDYPGLVAFTTAS